MIRVAHATSELDKYSVQRKISIRGSLWRLSVRLSKNSKRFKLCIWDREQAGAAANYLRLDDQALLLLKTAEFAGRKCVWVPHKDDEKSYVKGLLTGEKKDGKLEVEFEGTKKFFKEDIVEFQNPPKYDLVEDMANMTYLSEPAVLWNLR